MKNDLENEVKKKKSICITSRRQCNTDTPIERFFLSDFFYKIKHGEGVPGP